jgi:hypothetical protein
MKKRFESIVRRDRRKWTIIQSSVINQAGYSVKIRDKKIREKKIHLERKKEIKIKQVLKLKKKR